MGKICERCLWQDMECQIVLEDENVCKKFMGQVSKDDKEIVSKDNVILEEEILSKKIEQSVVETKDKIKEPVKKKKGRPVKITKPIIKETESVWVGNCFYLDGLGKDNVTETRYEVDPETGREWKIQVLKPGNVYKKDFFKKT